MRTVEIDVEKARQFVGSFFNEKHIKVTEGHPDVEPDWEENFNGYIEDGVKLKHIGLPVLSINHVLICPATTTRQALKGLVDVPTFVILSPFEWIEHGSPFRDWRFLKMESSVLNILIDAAAHAVYKDTDSCCVDLLKGDNSCFE
ncbi:MAG: hypothetical protein GY826_12590 [Fuerstiella sp.]|nr:hypothetical protein [Fuerstiella sp.]